MELNNLTTSRFAKILDSESIVARQAFQADLDRLGYKARKANSGSRAGGADNAKLRSAAAEMGKADQEAEKFARSHGSALEGLGNGRLYQADRQADFPLPTEAGNDTAAGKGLREVIMHGVYGPTESDRAEQISRMQESFNEAARADMNRLIDRCNDARMAWHNFQVEGEQAAMKLSSFEQRERSMNLRLRESEADMAKVQPGDRAQMLIGHLKLVDERAAIQAERQEFMQGEIARLDQGKAEYKAQLLDVQREADAFLEKHGWRYELDESQRAEISESQIKVPDGLSLADSEKWGKDVRAGFYQELNQQLQQERSVDRSVDRSEDRRQERGVEQKQEKSNDVSAREESRKEVQQEVAAGHEQRRAETLQNDNSQEKKPAEGKGVVYSEGAIFTAPESGKTFERGMVFTEMTAEEKRAQEQQLANAAGASVDKKQDMVQRLEERREQGAKQAEEKGLSSPPEETRSRASMAQAEMESRYGKSAAMEQTRTQGQQQAQSNSAQQDRSPDADRVRDAQQAMQARQQQAAQQQEQIQAQPQAHAPQQAPEPQPQEQRGQSMTM